MAEAPEDPPREETALGDRHPLTGAKIANLSPAVAEELEMGGLWDGVVITAIRRGQPAHRLGFKPRDVILSVNGVEVGQVDDLLGALTRPAERWSISFSRGGRVRTVEISG